MSDEPLVNAARVVVATPADAGDSIVGPKLFAVISNTAEQAEAAVRVVVTADEAVTVTGGPLKPETVERLELIPGEVKQIG